jgi:hypothetical protein
MTLPEFLQNIRKQRICLLLGALLFGAWLAYSGQYRLLTKLPTSLSRHINISSDEQYAKSKGTTIENLQQEFYDRQIVEYRDDRAKGLIDCHLFVSGPCAIQPLPGMVATGREPDWRDMIEGSTRAALDLAPLIVSLLASFASAIIAVYLLPVIMVRLIRWLAPSP